jgi:transposase
MVVKHVVVLEPLLTEQFIEHLPKASIVRQIFLMQVVHVMHILFEWRGEAGAELAPTGRLLLLQN